MGLLSVYDWALDIVMVALSFLLATLESLITVIAMLLPAAAIRWFARMSRRLMHMAPNVGEVEFESNPELLKHTKRVAKACSFVEICEIYGYDAEEHVVPTQDGYLLGVHRITGRRGAPNRIQIRNEEELTPPVVYLHHGLLMNSEVWVSVTEPQQSVAFLLADLGYDVWLGNNRGNKYSKKHVSRSSHSSKFWNFGLDEFALYDIPDTIDYILDFTDQDSLSYIGFSQGSAQAFASLAIHPELNHKVNLFIGLAPAMAPPGVNPFIQSLVNASPSILYMVFGQKIILRSSVFWQSIMNRALFVRVIDASVRLLFDWRGHNISYAQKVVGYAHLYSFTSVKSVVHWFQIIKSKKFQMYDDDEAKIGPFTLTRFYQALPYPTRNIRAPIVLIYGMADSLIDIQAMLRELPHTTEAIGVPSYEHLEMIWGRAVPDVIFPRILESLMAVNATPARPTISSAAALAAFLEAS